MEVSSINRAVKSNKGLIDDNGFYSFESRTGVCVDAIAYAASMAWAGYRLFIEEWDDNQVVVAVPDKYVRNGKPELFGFQFFVNEPGWFVDEKGGKTALIVFTEDDFCHASSEAWILCDEVFSEHFKEYTQIVGKFWGVRLRMYNAGDDNVGRLLDNPHRITAPRRGGKVNDENR